MEQEFQKLANFRDLGGLKGADGKAVRKTGYSARENCPK